MPEKDIHYVGDRKNMSYKTNKFYKTPIHKGIDSFA